MAPMYRVELEAEGCERCCAGQQWTVVGPDVVAISQSFEDQECATDLASHMNDAYDGGFKAGRRPRPKE